MKNCARKFREMISRIVQNFLWSHGSGFWRPNWLAFYFWDKSLALTHPQGSVNQKMCQAKIYFFVVDSHIHPLDLDIMLQWWRGGPRCEPPPGPLAYRAVHCADAHYVSECNGAHNHSVIHIVAHVMHYTRRVQQLSGCARGEQGRYLSAGS